MTQNVVLFRLSQVALAYPGKMLRKVGITPPASITAPTLAGLKSDVLSRSILGHFSIGHDFRKAVRGVDFYATNISANPYSKKVRIKSHPELAGHINKIIKDMPEFFNIFESIIGKYKGELHKHVFSAFQELLVHPEYQRLSPRKKNVMEIATLLHDMGKTVTEGTPHVKRSAEIATRMLKSKDIPAEDKELIIKLINNHHFSEEIKNGRMTHEDYTRIFNEDEFNLLKILVDSDIQSKRHIEPIQQYLDENIEFFKAQEQAFRSKKGHKSTSLVA